MDIERCSQSNRDSALKKEATMAHRSSISGRFVSRATAARWPRTTVTERGGTSAGTRHRSAITGRYVTPATAKRHPDTTVTERG